ncbi:MAG: hypothetical protein PSV13_02735 [Lacunisphaera sp.]|nr:hypothetical protein [Lacunisphaera sp.]
MNTLRWIASFPSAVLASFIAWVLDTKIFAGVHSTYGGGFFYSLVGLIPLITSAAIPACVFVLVGVAVAPSRKRRVGFVFFTLSLMFSAGGVDMLLFQDGYLPFWLASAAGITTGSVIGLAVALRVQRQSRPIQLPEPTSGLAPGRGSS